MFYEEIRIKQGIFYISFCPLWILYNSKFIIIATSLGTNVVVVRSFTVFGVILANNSRSGRFKKKCISGFSVPVEICEELQRLALQSALWQMVIQWCVVKKRLMALCSLCIRSCLSYRAFEADCCHYENTPIQIYRKFHLQKLKIFR